MTHTRIVKLYNIMETAEKTRLTAMLINEKHSKEVLKLNDYLVKNSNKTKKLEKEDVFQKIYGANLKFNEQKLTQLRYKLFNLAEDFLLTNWLCRKAKNNTDHLVQKLLLQLEYYRNKELPTSSAHTNDLAELINFTLRDIDRTLKKSEAKNIDYYFYQHKLNHHFYYSLGSKIWEKGREYLTELFNNLDIYYCLSKMRYYSEALNREISLNEDFDFISLNQVQQLVKESSRFNDKNIVLFDLYKSCLVLSNEINKDNLSQLINKTLQIQHFVDNRELGFIIAVITNYSTFLMRRSTVNISESIYEIYKLALKRNVFIVNGLLQPILLLNFSNLCSELQKFEEFDKIWEENMHKIESDFVEPTLNVCTAVKAFWKRDYKKAIEFTQRETRQRTLFYLYRKLLQIKSLYGLKFYAEIEDERTNFLKYIRSNKKLFNDFTYKCLYNFTQIMRDLINPNIDKATILNLFNDNNFGVVERYWLHQKIKEK